MPSHRHAVLAATAAMTVAISLPALASDASVKTRLESRGIKYVIDGDGDFKVTYNYSKEERTQLVFVSGKTETVGGFQVREVFSPAARIGKDGIDGKKAIELLENSRKYKLGGWEIGGDVLYFVIKLPDSVDAAALESAMDIAAEVADDMEIKLTGSKDDL
jgi:hypothetical protein